MGGKYASRVEPANRSKQYVPKAETKIGGNPLYRTNFTEASQMSPMNYGVNPVAALMDQIGRYWDGVKAGCCGLLYEKYIITRGKFGTRLVIVPDGNGNYIQRMEMFFDPKEIRKKGLRK